MIGCQSNNEAIEEVNGQEATDDQKKKIECGDLPTREGRLYFLTTACGGNGQTGCRGTGKITTSW